MLPLSERFAMYARRWRGPPPSPQALSFPACAKRELGPTTLVVQRRYAALRCMWHATPTARDALHAAQPA